MNTREISISNDRFIVRARWDLDKDSTRMIIIEQLCTHFEYDLALRLGDELKEMIDWACHVKFVE